ncbi:unnamed protein product [Camellia sinensis]
MNAKSTAVLGGSNTGRQQIATLFLGRCSVIFSVSDIVLLVPIIMLFILVLLVPIIVLWDPILVLLVPIIMLFILLGIHLYLISCSNCIMWASVERHSNWPNLIMGILFAGHSSEVSASR